MKYGRTRLERKRDLENRAVLGYRFKILLLDAGLSPEAAAQLLHVTPRTIRYWISGKVTVPYAAYRLLRITRSFELPGQGWEGWHMHSGKLWTPEGFAFLPSDGAWWSSLVRRARLFHVLYDRHQTGLGEAAPAASDRQARAGGADAPSPTAKRSGGEADRP